MTKILIGVPCMENIPIEFAQSLYDLKAPDGVKTDLMFMSMSLVYIAREKIVDAAVCGGYDYVFFVDSDMVFKRDTLIKLYEAKMDIVSGLAFMRSPPYSPCLYKTLRIGEGRNTVERLEDFNGLERIEACGMACCLIKTEVFKAIREKSLCFLPLPTLGEDMAFCVRARERGFEVWGDTRVKLGHKSSMIVNEATWRGWNECEC